MGKVKYNANKDKMESALDSVKHGKFTIYKASKYYGVPKETLRRNIRQMNMKEKAGVGTLLTKDEETILHDWVLDMSDIGFGVSKRQFISSVAQFAERNQKRNPFQGGIPSNCWYQGFIKRHPDLSLRLAENVHSRKSDITEGKIKQWFDEVTLFAEHNDMDFLNDPSRIFNLDETAFFLCPKEKVLSRKGCKQVKRKCGNSGKENYTVLLCANAKGVIAPPFLLFPKNKNITQAFSHNMPSDWAIGRSEKGWMTSETYYEYI